MITFNFYKYGSLKLTWIYYEMLTAQVRFLALLVVEPEREHPGLKNEANTESLSSNPLKLVLNATEDPYTLIIKWPAAQQKKV